MNQPTRKFALALLVLATAPAAQAFDFKKALKGAADMAAAAAAPAPAPGQAAAPGGDVTRNPLAALKLVGELVAQDNVEEEIELGRQMGAQLLGAAKPLDNPELQRYVGLVGWRVAQQSERPELPWRFVLLDDDDINAFAAPGGKIFVTKGLYNLLTTEDELASVLGHEVAHVVRKHHYKVLKKQKLMGAATEVAAAKLGEEKHGGALSMLAKSGGELLGRGLDKGAEFEADRDGVVLAARAGYDSTAFLTLLERLSALPAENDSLKLLYGTHPAPETRSNKLLEAFSPELEVAAVPSSAAGRLLKLTP
jgi:predicted Zn-dependent protease